MDAEHIAYALDRDARQNSSGWTCRCPAHDDEHASLSLSDADDGRVLWFCHAGCNQDDVREELQRRGLLGKPNGPDRTTSRPRQRSDHWRPLMPVPESAEAAGFRHARHGQASATWTYRDANGALLFHVARFDLADGDGGKEILPRCYGTLNGGRGWQWKAAPQPRPLYGLDRLAKRPLAPVLVVEGEKTAAAARKLVRDHVVVTWPGGAKAISKVDWTPLQGRRVAIWPDADTPGQKAAKAIAGLLRHVATSVRIVELPTGLPDGWDLADQIPNGLDVEALIEAAPAYEPEPEDEDDEVEETGGIELRAIASFEEREVDWLWPDTIACGEVAVWAGEPDTGKTTALVSVIGLITRGRPWPDGRGAAPKGEVLILTVENDPSTTLRPRLRVAGANLAKVYTVGVHRDGEFEILDTLIDQFPKLDEALERRPATVLVGIDPIFDFVTTTKVNSAAEVRQQVIKPLTRLARKHGVAIVLIIHLNKVVGQSARMRVSGADAWTTAPRLAFLFGEHPKHEGLRVAATLRNSLSKERGALAYTIKDEAGVPRIEWREERMQVHAEELVQPPSTKVDQCATWLKAYLADGPKPVKEVQTAAKKQGFKPWHLRQATERLAVKRVKPDFTSGWVWELPS